MYIINVCIYILFICDLNMKRFVCVFNDISPFCSLVSIGDEFYELDEL